LNTIKGKNKHISKYWNS